MSKNVCRFFTRNQNKGDLELFNCVLETLPQTNRELKIPSVYRMHLVLHGTGRLCLTGREIPLAEGDLFFTLPSVPAAICSDDGFQYMYISFLGSRANAVMETMHITGTDCVFSGFFGLFDLWCRNLEADGVAAALRVESTLLYSFSVLGERRLLSGPVHPSGDGAALLVKQYIDQFFFKPEISLESVGQACGYHPKYVSTVFKHTYKIGFSRYLNTVRIRNACMLMKQGESEVQSIALRCGYRDPLYFSRLFKEYTGHSPRAYMASLRSASGTAE